MLGSCEQASDRIVYFGLVIMLYYLIKCICLNNCLSRYVS